MLASETPADVPRLLHPHDGGQALRAEPFPPLNYKKNRTRKGKIKKSLNIGHQTATTKNHTPSLGASRHVFRG
jgi:hypothetical protein